jgi:two-component system C4-dicarboxylate transport sensor histidine kinase DctB
MTPKTDAISVIAGPTEGDGGLGPAEALRLAELAELGVMTASLLHELRQPLFAVKGRLQLARHARRPIQGEELDGVLQSVEHLEQLLEHYAGLSRPEDTWIELDVRDEVRRAVGMLAHRTKAGQVALQVSLPEERLLVRGRPVAIRQVVLNLLGNALDAVSLRDGSVVEIRAERLLDRIRLEVEDNGPGLPAEVRDRLFQAFVTTKAPGRGTGLGLYIARRLIEEVGGELVAASDASGTRMTVDLPCQ